MAQQIEAHSPEMAEHSEPVEMHIMKKRGKFHGHVVMSDGAEHHAAPAESMHEAHAALGEHVAPQEQMAEVEPEPQPEPAIAMAHAYRQARG